MDATQEAIDSIQLEIQQREAEERYERELEYGDQAVQEPYMIPKEFLCIEHQDNIVTPPSGSLAHQIDQVRRDGCECNIETIWLWYDLIGFQYDLLTDENEEKQSKSFTNSRKRDIFIV